VEILMENSENTEVSHHEIKYQQKKQKIHFDIECYGSQIQEGFTFDGFIDDFISILIKVMNKISIENF